MLGESNSVTVISQFLFSLKEILQDTQVVYEGYLVKIDKANTPKRQPSKFSVIDFFFKFHEYL